MSIDKYKIWLNIYYNFEYLQWKIKELIVLIY